MSKLIELTTAETDFPVIILQRNYVCLLQDMVSALLNQVVELIFTYISEDYGSHIASWI